MPVRKPVAAGSFYPADSASLEQMVSICLERSGDGAPPADNHDIWGLMLPHAGHVYCGKVIGETLAHVQLPDTLIILCPNHTGLGKPLGVWTEGTWLTPLGAVPVDSALATALVESDGGFAPDTASHAREHSIEVILPFLQRKIPNLSIVPVAVGTANPALLQKAGHALAHVLKTHPQIGVIISSDMNHYEDHVTTLAKDELALACACAGDADALLRVTANERISMCGAPALALALYAASDLGYSTNIVTSHTTSGEAFGDYERTVGYAGMRLCR